MVDPTPLDKVLALRPTNVVSRFGADSRLPLLNPRDLAAALDQARAALPCFPVYAPQAIAGILRASRDDDAPVGLSCPWPATGRGIPARFVDALRAATEHVRHRKPLFLQAGPIRVNGPGAAEVVHAFVDAGFTSVSLDASELGGGAVEAYRQALAPLAELELSVEIAAPMGPERKLSPPALLSLLERLAAAGTLVQSVRVPVRSFATQEEAYEPWQLDLDALSRTVGVAHEHGAVVAVEDDGPSSVSLAPAWVEAGARRAEAIDEMARLFGRVLPSDRFQALQDEASFAGVPVREKLALAGWSGEPLDPAQGLRLEALCWAAASDFIGAVRARGTAVRTVTFLARGGRY